MLSKFYYGTDWPGQILLPEERLCGLDPLLHPHIPSDLSLVYNAVRCSCTTPYAHSTMPMRIFRIHFQDLAVPLTELCPKFRKPRSMCR